MMPQRYAGIDQHGESRLINATAEEPILREVTSLHHADVEETETLVLEKVVGVLQGGHFGPHHF